MHRPRVLHLEDDGDFSELLARAFRKAGLDIELVTATQPDEFRAALDQGGYDLVIADRSVRGYDGLAALREARKRGVSAPVVVVSGALPAEGTQAYIAAGAADYLVKDDLAQIAEAVRRLLPTSSGERPARAEPRADSALLLAAAVKQLARAATAAEVASIAPAAARSVGRADAATFAVRRGDTCRHVGDDGVGPLFARTEPDLPLDESVSGLAIRGGQAVVIEDVEQDGRAGLTGSAGGMRSAVAVPVGRGLPTAAIALYWSEPHRPSAEELELVTALADLAALALERAEPPERPGRAAAQAKTSSEWEPVARMISHDLRNPLWQIRGFGELLVEDHGVALGDDGRDKLDHLLQATAQLERVIDALVELANVSGAPLAPRAVDLSAAARDIMALLSSEAPDRSVEWRVRDGLVAWADPALVRTLLEKLLANALRCTRGRAVARVELGASAEAGDMTTFFVRDNGVGFHPAEKARLFSPFQPIAALTGDPGATAGAGLAAVRRIIHRLGGEVWADAAPDAGATFYFALPAPLA
jgi:signal transduction histidine kinase/CheY-like chemotaxis protein